MLKNVIDKLFRRRHFWRNVGFDELSELYASEFMRSLAMSVIGIFVPIYLYKLGYSLQDIFVMQIAWAASRPLFAYISAKFIAAFGPKHSIAMGTIIQILYLLVLISVGTFNWPLILLGILGSLSYALFGIALQVDFSKVKHVDHGGKELGFITICEKVGSVIGPLVGGLVASLINPQVSIVIAISILFLSLWPLFTSSEPTKTKQKIRLKGFPWHQHKRDFMSGIFFGVENIVSITIWPLFIAIVVFSDNAYSAIGIIIAVSTAIALLSIYLIGKLIDDKKGLILLNTGVIINAFMHLLRPFVTLPSQAASLSFINEPITSSYRMPYLKGLYDATDSVTGYRIVYVTIFDLVRMSGQLVFWLIAYVLSFFIVNDADLLRILFVFGAIASLGIMIQRFPALVK